VVKKINVYEVYEVYEEINKSVQNNKHNLSELISSMHNNSNTHKHNKIMTYNGTVVRIEEEAHMVMKTARELAVERKKKKGEQEEQLEIRRIQIVTSATSNYTKYILLLKHFIFDY